MSTLGLHWTPFSSRSHSPCRASRTAQMTGPPTTPHIQPQTGLDTFYPDDGSTWLSHRHHCLKSCNLILGQCKGTSPSQSCHSATHCPSWRQSTAVTSLLCPDKDILCNNATSCGGGYVNLVHRLSACKNWWKLSKVWATALFSMTRFSLKMCFNKSYFSSKKKEKKNWVRYVVW